MRNFTYVIGSTDDFENVDDLRQYYLADGNDGPRNFSVIPVSLSESCHVEGYRSLAELATIIARGEAMTDGWCLDDTVSILLEG